MTNVVEIHGKTLHCVSLKGAKSHRNNHNVKTHIWFLSN